MRVPLFVEVKDKNILVLGGGLTGTKRALKFAQAGAKVVVLSREFSDELFKAGRELGIILVQIDLSSPETIPILETWIRWADIVIYTIPDQTLAEIVRTLCKRYRKLLNDATSAEKTEIVVPFETRILDSIRIAVTTEGRSSTLSKILVRKIETMLQNDNEIRNLANAFFTMKKILKECVSDFKTRMKLYEEITNDKTFLELATKGSLSEVEKYVKEKISEALGQRSS